MTTPTLTAAIRMHHHAYVTTDQEATRRFYEDVVGLPLVATWAEHADGQESCHTFFELSDGSALAFFQFADLEYSEQSAPPPPFSPYRHLALLVDSDSQDAIRDRAETAGVDTLTLDHGYCRSLYLNDPNGLILEFTIDHPAIDTIAALQKKSAHAQLARWLSGDRSTNNDWRWA